MAFSFYKIITLLNITTKLTDSLLDTNVVLSMKCKYRDVLIIKYVGKSTNI